MWPQIRIKKKYFLLISSSKIGTVILFVLIISGCSDFNRFEPSPVGMFYPKHPMLDLKLDCATNWQLWCRISITEPVEIRAVGMYAWHAMIGHHRKAAIIAVKLPPNHSCDYDEFYAPIAWLEANGRIEYTGQKTSSDYFWESGFGIFIKCIILLIIIFVIYGIIGQRKQAILIQLNAAELKRKEENEKIERELKRKKEIEIERRKNIILEIINVNYKETEKEVNKTLIPTLINELYDIFIGIHSENINEIVMNGSTIDFQVVTDSIKSELKRLKLLSIEAQKRGYTEDDNYEHSENKNIMSKEKAFGIFGLKPTSTKEEIKKTYKRLAFEFHPDRAGQTTESIKKLAEEKFKEIQTAYNCLIN